MPIKVIQEFLIRYVREYDFYSQLASLAQRQLDEILRLNGIRAIVTARAKNRDRLEAKLKQRYAKKRYSGPESIYEDIVDLAGVRVALYFPGDKERVGELLARVFYLEQSKKFPEINAKDTNAEIYNKRFSGYHAIHYRAKIMPAVLPAELRRYCEAKLEIQVASVLMHAWSEVEHDLIYKPMQGELSYDEYAILDELNGLVLTGEISLERLQHAIEQRVEKSDVKFSNHYELAAYLYEKFKVLLKDADSDKTLGNVQGLFKLLQYGRKDSRIALDPYLEEIRQANQKQPVANQILDLLLYENSEFKKEYEQIRRRQFLLSLSDEQGADVNSIGIFMKEWGRLECVARRLNAISGELNPLIGLKSFVDRLDAVDRSEFTRIRRTRNNLVHGVEVPDTSYLLSMAEAVRELLRKSARQNVEIARALENCG